MAKTLREESQWWANRAEQHEKAGNAQAAGIARDGARVTGQLADKHDEYRARTQRNG